MSFLKNHLTLVKMTRKMLFQGTVFNTLWQYSVCKRGGERWDLTIDAAGGDLSQMENY